MEELWEERGNRHRADWSCFGVRYHGISKRQERVVQIAKSRKIARQVKNFALCFGMAGGFAAVLGALCVVLCGA